MFCSYHWLRDCLIHVRQSNNLSKSVFLRWYRLIILHALFLFASRVLLKYETNVTIVVLSAIYCNPCWKIMLEANFERVHDNAWPLPYSSIFYKDFHVRLTKLPNCAHVKDNYTTKKVPTFHHISFFSCHFVLH